MPSISKIRLTNIVYEEGNKRYNDELFLFDGHNGAVLLENGGGKTVLIQTALQAIIPHVDLADRKMKKTLMLENAPAHIAIEWITNDNPRRYVVTAVSLFTTKQGLDSLRYVYEYDANDPNDIEGIPFVKEGKANKRTAEIGEMQDYYGQMRDKTFSARTFNTIKSYRHFLEEQYHIIASEWDSIVKINSTEGGVEAFFDACKSTNQLFDRLLIPTVEHAIVGHETRVFADMFEQQHASFKNYQKLKETIEENKQIEAQLEQYVRTYGKLHNHQLDYQKVKQRAKGAWIAVNDQEKKIEKEQQQTIDKLQQWQLNNHAHRVKTASFEISVEETRHQALDQDYQSDFAEKVEQEENLEQYRKDYYSLKRAELERDRNEQIEELNHIKVEISKFEQTEEIETFQEQLAEEKQMLLGWYQTEIEKLASDKRNQTYQLNPIIEQMTELDKQKQVAQKKEQELRDALSKIKGIMQSRRKDMERLKQQLLAKPDQENVDELLVNWQKRSQFLDDEMIRLRAVEKELILAEKQGHTRKNGYQQEVLQIDGRKNEIVYQLNQMNAQQKSLLENLTTLRPQWSTLDTIYLSQDSTESRLIEAIDKRKKERNTLLLQERISYRFVDDHGDQEKFFGDAFLEKQLNYWKNQVDYLLTGVEYLQTISEKERDKLAAYPLWAITLVTTSKMKPKVIEKVRHIANSLQFPISVITTEEAITLDERVTNPSWVAPDHWRSNVSPDPFTNWKDAIKQDANEITLTRERKETEINRWEDVFKAFNQFLDTFPFQHVTDLQEQLSTANNELKELTVKQEKEQRFITEQQEKREKNKTQIEQHQEEKQGLDGKMDKALDYIQYEKEWKEQNAKEKDVQESLNEVIRNGSNLDQQIKGLVDERDYLQDRLRNLDIHLTLIEEDEQYLELKELTPQYTTDGKKIIQERIATLQMKIRAITVTQGEWLAKQEAAVKALKRFEQQIEAVILEHPQIEKERVFPSDGKQVMEILWKRIAQLNRQVVKTAQHVQEKKAHVDEQKGKWNAKLEQFKRDFARDEMIVFNKLEEEIAAELQAEQDGLFERKTYIDQEVARIEKALTSNNHAKYDLEMFEEAHHFTAPDIEPTRLTADEALDFSYHHKRFVKTITDKLKQTKNKVTGERVHVDQARRKFSDFCRNSISNIKLQQMAINGVENKQNYADITDFKKNMLTSITMSSHYANEHIRKSDEDLQLFINQIHTHLETLVEEIRQIPKKTHVKVADGSKQIFNFTLPEWEEEVGKTRIRDYIEWILQQLEIEQSGQDAGRTRKQIEVWLQSKQLLQIVMNNEAMKVSCRKVTNDSQVTTRPYSWEQSNLWSGGEKWSKNMTLFLGILNYVAEKKKHIQSTMKRHRTVILDNPFGKASSEHVLSPVFFVAEQLGFQIIALTAHAEGKFLQDYFPVIYSCRLRAATDPSKKVMTKEKWLHHAYFQDHDPKTIDRLGEIEQLALFEEK